VHGNTLIYSVFFGLVDKCFLNPEVYAMFIPIGDQAVRAAKRGRNERGQAADGGGREFTGAARTWARCGAAPVGPPAAVGAPASFFPPRPPVTP